MKTLSLVVFLFSLSLNVHADQWKVSNQGNSYAAHRRSLGYHQQRRKVDKSRRSADSRAENELESARRVRRLSSGPQDACTHWCVISFLFYCFQYSPRDVIVVVFVLLVYMIHIKPCLL